MHDLDADVNDPAFALAMADRLHELIEASRHDEGEALARLRAQIAPGVRSSAPALAPASLRNARRQAAPT